MATKTISDAYQAGYYLDPAFQTLIIADTATVGGTGVTTTATQPTTVYNRGSVNGTQNGITLSDGGTINNGTLSDPTALISGLTPILIQNGAGNVRNWGTIRSKSAAFGEFGPSIVLMSGGDVSNLTAGSLIREGIKISGATGTVVNRGSVNGPHQYFSYTDPYGPGDFDVRSEGPSVELRAGGSITNGSLQQTSASLSQGIKIAGGTGSIVNFGSIGAAHNEFHTYYRSKESDSYSIVLSAGGSVTNGTATNHTASISNGISISGRAGTVSNDGTIGGPSSYYYDAFEGSSTTSTGFSVLLRNGGTVINGGTTNSAASLTNGVSLQRFAGKVTNFGVIGSNNSDGLAVSFDNAGDVLIQQGTGVLGGKVSGGGGTLVLAGDAGQGTIGGVGSTIADFATVKVDAGASWNLTGANTIVAGSLFDNKGTIGATGLLTNHGTFTSSGVIGLGTTGQIANHPDGKLYLVGDVGVVSAAGATKFGLLNTGLLQKSSGAGTSIIRTSAASTGKIVVASGKLEFAGKKTRIAGSIAGAGTVWFGPGAATLDAGTKITTGGLQIGGSGAHVTVGLDLGYAGAFAAGTNTELTIADGDMLLLAGSASFGKDTIDGAGRIVTQGTTTLSHVIFGGVGQWLNAGTISETAQFTLGDVNGLGAVFVNQAGGVFDITGNSGIDGTASTATFKNAGLLEKTAGAKSVIGVALVNTGTVEAASGTLDLQGAVTGTGGILKIDAGKAIQADAAVSGGQMVDFNGGGDKLVLTDATHFGGKLQDFGLGDKLDLRQFDPAATTLSFAENGADTAGALTVTDGSLTTKITLLGQYMTSGFHTTSDGLGGTFITYTPQAAAALATPHS